MLNLVARCDCFHCIIRSNRMLGRTVFFKIQQKIILCCLDSPYPAEIQIFLTTSLYKKCVLIEFFAFVQKIDRSSRRYKDYKPACMLNFSGEDDFLPFIFKWSLKFIAFLFCNLQLFLNSIKLWECRLTNGSKIDCVIVYASMYFQSTFWY